MRCMVAVFARCGFGDWAIGRTVRMDATFFSSDAKLKMKRKLSQTFTSSRRSLAVRGIFGNGSLSTAGADVRSPFGERH